MITIPAPTIPTSFVKIDDRVTTNDGFVNVHDQQLARDNHNILLSRRIRGNCLGMTGLYAASSPPRTITGMKSTERPPIIQTGSFLVNPLCRIIRVAIYAERTRATPATNPTIGIFIWPWGSSPTPLDEARIPTMTVSAASGSPAWYTVDVPLRYPFQDDSKIAPRWGGKIPVGFSVYSLCQIDTTAAAVLSAAVVVSADNRSIRYTSVTSSGMYQSIEVDTALREPSMIVKHLRVGGDNLDIVDPPFVSVPLDTDTVTVRHISGALINAMLFNELTIADFDTASAPI